MECLASRGKAPGSVLAISISLLLSPLSLPLSHPPSLSYSYPQHSPHKDQAIIKSHGVKLSRGDSHGQSVSEQRLRRELLDREGYIRIQALPLSALHWAEYRPLQASASLSTEARFSNCSEGSRDTALKALLRYGCCHQLERLRQAEDAMWAKRHPHSIPRL